ncbi:putative UPF0481 protein At3g02645 [Camellia sinensis]|uniref:putative UPF0481 protein At3g02645 n=1 Tax=Camellia sinensis TaxID=4442 RepID=UPI0010366020|nr:putative UPF0481 protein At3g02645 [Camellia sinensis]
MATSSIFDSSSNERQWINEIKNIIEEEVKVDIEVPVSIFRVPAALSAFKPETYMPQLIGLGPYHHLQPELYEMERYKLAAASRLQKQFQSLEFEQLVDKLMEFEYKVRACYHNKTDIYDTALVDSAGRKLSHDSILSDIMMLENQIPFFLLRKILSIQCASIDLDDNSLPLMLTPFCKAISPPKLMENFPLSQVFEYAHLLDLLYHLMVPKLEETQKPSTTDVQKSTTKFNAKQHVDSGMSNLASKSKEKIKPENPISNEGQKAPQVEKIMIPSVSYLSNIAGVEFYPTTGDITTIRFEEEEKRFYLPVITLNVHSEVIMRNLVAYEASTVSESLVFAGYTELLNGIMETVEDAKLLREKKIIINRLKSDDEVLQLFNSINKSIQLTHVPYVDKAIEDVNRFFYNSRRVQAYKWIKKYVYGSWKIFTLLATILVMLLMALQSFCSVYSCTSIVRKLNTTIHS